MSPTNHRDRFGNNSLNWKSNPVNKTMTSNTVKRKNDYRHESKENDSIDF